MSVSNDQPNGYHPLAQVMSLDPGTAMFKRFAQLNAHSLLIQQAEILDLERQLLVLATVNKKRGLHYNTIAIDLINAGRANNDDEQWRLVLHIRSKLKDYSMCNTTLDWLT